MMSNTSRIKILAQTPTPPVVGSASFVPQSPAVHQQGWGVPLSNNPSASQTLMSGSYGMQHISNNSSNIINTNSSSNSNNNPSNMHTTNQNGGNSGALNNQGLLPPVVSAGQSSRLSAMSDTRLVYEQIAEEKNRALERCSTLEFALEKERQQAEYIQSKMKVVILENDRLTEEVQAQRKQILSLQTQSKVSVQVVPQPQQLQQQQYYSSNSNNLLARQAVIDSGAQYMSVGQEQLSLLDKRVIEDLEHRCYELLTENQKLQALVNQEKIMVLEIKQEYEKELEELRVQVGELAGERGSLLSENDSLIRAFETISTELNEKRVEMDRISLELVRVQHLAVGMNSKEKQEAEAVAAAAAQAAAIEKDQAAYIESLKEQIYENVALLENQQNQIHTLECKLKDAIELQKRYLEEIRKKDHEVIVWTKKAMTLQERELSNNSSGEKASAAHVVGRIFNAPQQQLQSQTIKRRDMNVIFESDRQYSQQSQSSLQQQPFVLKDVSSAAAAMNSEKKSTNGGVAVELSKRELQDQLKVLEAQLENVDLKIDHIVGKNSVGAPMSSYNSSSTGGAYLARRDTRS